jgi:hypothetical protein
MYKFWQENCFKTSSGGLSRRWKDNIKINLREIGSKGREVDGTDSCPCPIVGFSI